MENSIARVAVNGYGVIGKRVADAVALQDDMELVGVADVIMDSESAWRSSGAIPSTPPRMKRVPPWRWRASP